MRIINYKACILATARISFRLKPARAHFQLFHAKAISP